MSFAWPWMFLLLPLPFLVRWLLPVAQSNSQDAIFVPFFSNLSAINSEQKSVKRNFRQFFLWLLWGLLLIAATRPQLHEDPIPLQREGRDIMLVLDLSGSMIEQDMRVGGRTATRLDALKHVSKEFVSRRAGDRIGIILFACAAYLHAPLTYDLDTVQQLISEIEMGLAGRRTAIGDGIGFAIKHMRDKNIQDRVIVLLTDGANNTGEVMPMEAAEMAASLGLRIHTIGFGADEMIVRDPFWGTRRVNPTADLDEDMMIRIAELTGGKYFRARSTEELDKVYKMIDELEPISAEGGFFRPVRELYYWPLAFLFLLSILATLMRIIRDLRYSLSVMEGSADV